MPNTKLVTTFTVIPAVYTDATAFEVHAAGCRDLRRLETPFAHTVDATDAANAVRAQEVDLGGLVGASDFTVMPCCNPKRLAAAGRFRPVIAQ
jgi:hypothetical protein